MPDAPTLTSPAGTGACRACGAPLAADQRYCLDCGARVTAPRVAFLDVLAGQPATPTASALPAPAGSRPARSLARQLDRVGGPMGASAVVLVALGIGFLIGQDGSGGGPATVIQRPPVVNVQSSGAAAAAPADTTATDTGGAGGTGGRAKGGGASTKGVAPAIGGTTGGDLTKLQAQPKEQATQGAPPKKDTKPAGGGSAKETIG